MSKTLITRASLVEAANKPEESLIATFGRMGLGRHVNDWLMGRSPVDLFGAEQGFMDVPGGIATIPGMRGTTVDGQNVNEIWNEMQMMLAAFNASASQFVANLTFDTVKANEKVGVPTSPGFQKATEFGRPSKVRLTNVARGFPLDHYDLGDGFTQEFIDSNTGAQLLAIQATVLNSWETLRRELVLDAIFRNTNYTDKDGIAVKALYNADGEVPPAIKRWTHTGSHTHYLTTAGASLVVADLDALADDLIHHGFKEFGDATFILHANRLEVQTIRGFTGYVPAEEATVPTELPGSGVIRGRQGSAPGSLRVQGYIGEWVVVENNDIPEGYLLGQVSGGPFDTRNVVGLRRHDNPSVGGQLRLIEGNRQNYPLYDSVYDGYLGAGVAQRGAAAVMQVTAGAYTRPTFSTGE